MIYKVVEYKYDDFLYNIKKYFSNDKNETIFKQRNIIKLVEYQEVKYVVKSFRIPHFINRVVYRFFRESKAKRSYQNSVKLLELGINTPKPIGFSEFNTMFFFQESFYVSELFDYDFEIRALFSDQNFTNRENILKEFVKFTYELHNSGVNHIDYSPGNILVKEDNGKYTFYIVDVNRMKFMPFDINLRAGGLVKLTTDKNDNNFMIKEYAKILDCDLDTFTQKFDLAKKEHEQYLENKKRLKKLKS